MIANVGRRRVGTVDVTVRRRTDAVHVLSLLHVIDNVLLLLLVVVVCVLLKLGVASIRESITETQSRTFC